MAAFGLSSSTPAQVGNKAEKEGQLRGGEGCAVLGDGEFGVLVRSSGGDVQQALTGLRMPKIPGRVGERGREFVGGVCTCYLQAYMQYSGNSNACTHRVGVYVA